MTRTTFIHTSDWQLGMRRKFLGDDAQSRFNEARLRAVERLGELAGERGAEFIVVAGDTFEHNALEAQTHLRALEALRALPVPVYLLPGNHDPLTAGSILTREGGVADLAHVHVLADSAPVEVRPGVELVGAPLRTKHASEDLCAAAVAALEPTEAVRVLVGHGAVKGFGDAEARAIIDVAGLDAAAEEGVVDYVALGDTHSTVKLKPSGRVWYSGSPETTDFHDLTPGTRDHEVDSGNALVVTVEKEGLRSSVEVEKVPVGNWTFEARFWEVADEADVDRVVADLQAYPNKDHTVIKYVLEGTLGLEATRKLEGQLGSLEHVFAALYERERLMNLHLEPDDEELEQLPLAGYAREAMRELVGLAADGEEAAGAASERATARDAVNLLFRLSQEA